MQSPRRLIIVEDEPLISMMVEQMSIELGWKVEGCAYSEKQAFTLLDRCSPTLALLDLNLGGGTTSLAVAEACRVRGIPIVFTTGYTMSQIPDACGDAPILAKPFSSDDLQMAFKQATDRVAVIAA